MSAQGNLRQRISRIMLDFTIRCIPTPQQRPRHMRTKTGIDLTYKSKRQKDSEATLHALLAPHVPPEPLTGGLELQFIAIMPLPTSVTKKKQGSHVERPDRAYRKA